MNPITIDHYKKSKILVLCDSDDELAAIQPLLHADRFQCLATSSESEVLTWLKAKHPAMLIVSYAEVELAERFIRSLRQYNESQGGDLTRGLLLLCRGVHASRAFELYRAGLVGGFVVSRPIVEPLAFRAAVLHLLERCALQEKLRDSKQALDGSNKGIKDLRFYLEHALDEGQVLLASASDMAPVAPWLQALREGVALRLDGLQEFHDAGSRADAAALVMIVEDEPTYRTILRTMLESGGYRVIEAADGENALEQLKVARPNLIILDFLMPGLDGMETLKQIKAHPMLSAIPVMMLSGMSDKDLVRESIRQGAVDFVVKPSNRVTLMNKVQVHLR